VISGLIRTPHPVPGRLAPAIAGSAVIVLALPIFLIAGWRVSGWALAAVLWVASLGAGLLFARLPLGAGNLARAGVVAFGMMLRAIAVMVVLVAVAVHDARLGLSAAVVYAFAYTTELGVSMLEYFGSES
jgi:hypothetical protein